MIRFDSVTKHYPGGARAIEDFTVTVPTGSITVLVGSSGCGKTTLLRMVNRMVEPTSGAIFIDDTNVAERDPVELRRSIGYVMQSGGLLPHKTVGENIATVAKLRGVAKMQRLERVNELMSIVGLEPGLLERYPAQLSGGQQQRVGVARALAVDPNILLMDEPFGAVDPVVRADLQQELLELQHTLAKTVLFVTHDIEEAFLLGDQVVLLESGHGIVQQGTPAEIISHPASPFVETFIGAHKGKRSLRLVQDDGVTIVVDANNRVAGRLEKDL